MKKLEARDVLYSATLYFSLLGTDVLGKEEMSLFHIQVTYGVIVLWMNKVLFFLKSMKVSNLGKDSGSIYSG